MNQIIDSFQESDINNKSIINNGNININLFLDDVLSQLNNRNLNKINIDNICYIQSINSKSVIKILQIIENISSLRILRQNKYNEYLKFYLTPRERYICVGTMIDYLKNSSEWEWLFNNLSDKESQNTLTNYIKIRIMASLIGKKGFDKISFSNKYTNNNRYINKYQYKNIIKINQGDIIIDAGAYIGKDSIAFSYLNGFKNYIYSFEPQDIPFKILTKNIKKYNLEKYIKPYKLGLWSNNNKNILRGQGSSASITCLPDQNIYHVEKINCISIDNFLNNNEINFIKMDIEGAELNALKGAKDTITIYKPKLAISVYHDIRDIIEISKYIKNIRPDYKLFLQQLQPGIKETVLFAT